VKSYSKIDWAKGHVLILSKHDITISGVTYKRRFRVYDNYIKWVNTLPLAINLVDKSLILYKKMSTALILFQDI